MEEEKRVIQLISAEAIEDYIHLARITSYKTGFGDGVKSSTIFFGAGLGIALTIGGAIYLGYLISNKMKEDKDGSEQIPEQFECVED